MTALPIVVAALAGVLTWTFLEYMIHRFLGHDARFRPNPFASEHVRHHSEGDYFAPAWKKLLAAVAIVAVLYVPATSLLGLGAGLAYIFGLMSFYGAYEVMHRLDHTHAGSTAWGRWQRRNHFAHHYCDTRFNHGVTSPLWDFVFNTYRPVQQIRVPSRFVMPWLKDEAGAVKPEFAQLYVLADRPAAPASPAPAQPEALPLTAR